MANIRILRQGLNEETPTGQTRQINVIQEPEYHLNSSTRQIYPQIVIRVTESMVMIQYHPLQKSIFLKCDFLEGYLRQCCLERKGGTFFKL
jgi:hypothetical protein